MPLQWLENYSDIMSKSFNGISIVMYSGMFNNLSEGPNTLHVPFGTVP